MLQDQVIVVTGGTGQLGRAVVEAVVAQGAHAALIGRQVTDSPADGKTWQANLASLDDATRAMADIASSMGRIDGLVNVAGGFRWQTVADSTDLGEWEAMFDVNLRTCVNACRAALPHLLRQSRGRIVNVGAMAAHKAASGMGAYAASKAGVARLTEALADELKLKNVTVNAVLPSIIDTPANRADMPEADHSRWVSPSDIAQVIVFLLSESARAVTGALIPVTGKT